MACSNKNRQRPRTVSFRMTDNEFIRLEQRVKITGEVKGDYLRNMALNGEININVGKFKSEKLALELKRLYEELHCSLEGEIKKNINHKVEVCCAMVREIYSLVITI